MDLADRAETDVVGRDVDTVDAEGRRRPALATRRALRHETGRAVRPREHRPAACRGGRGPVADDAGHGPVAVRGIARVVHDAHRRDTVGLAEVLRTDQLAGEPGELIRAQDLGEADGVATVRVMYHSRDAEDRDRAVTGIISYRTAPAPEGGWPVLSWAHGTTGLVSECAPSREGGPAPAFGVDGVHVATDYIGLGPVGEVHPYLLYTSD